MSNDIGLAYVWSTNAPSNCFIDQNGLFEVGFGTLGLGAWTIYATPVAPGGSAITASVLVIESQDSGGTAVIVPSHIYPIENNHTYQFTCNVPCTWSIIDSYGTVPIPGSIDQNGLLTIVGSDLPAFLSIYKVVATPVNTEIDPVWAWVIYPE